MELFSADAFFDGSSVLPLDAVKPSPTELQRSVSGLDIPLPHCVGSNDSVTRDGFVYPTRLMRATRFAALPWWAPVKGVATEGVVDRVTPNLFFRFHSQLYAVYCNVEDNGSTLVHNIRRVRSLPSLHRRCWSCAGSRTPSVCRTFSSTCSSCSPAKLPRRWV